MSIQSKTFREGETPTDSDRDESELPVGWAVATLQEVGAWRSGGTPSRTKSEYFGQGIPWVKSGDLPDGPITKTDEQITQLGLENSAAKLMPTGTICMALYGATIGKLGTMTFGAATNQATANLVPDERLVDGQYVFHYLMSERQNFIDLGQGGAQPNISQEIVRKHPIKLAPLAEQRRIVGKLELLLGKVSSSQQRLSRVQGLLKRFRQSVLAAACSGKLTADWREGNPAEDLECVYTPDYEVPTIPSSWSWHVIKEIGDVKSGKRLPKGRELVNEDTGHLYLRAGNLKDGTVRCDGLLFVPLDVWPKIKNYTVVGGDVYITIVGACIGDAGVIPEQLSGANLTENAAKICNLRKINSYFLANWLRSQHCQTIIQQNILSAAQGKLALFRIQQLPVPLPPLSEQQEIVRRVEKLFAFADQIEARLRQAQSHVDRLTQSLLAKAFRGELVPTEHSLATAEGRDYEPATALLARIHAGRVATENPKTRKTKSRAANQ